MLQNLRVIISLGIESVPLACVGAEGYLARLLFWICLPLILVGIATVGVLAYLLVRRRRPISVGNILKYLTPIALRIIFLT